MPTVNYDRLLNRIEVPAYENFEDMFDAETADRKSTRLNSSHLSRSRMPSSA